MKLNRLPAALSSRDGWTELLELKRPTEPHIHQIEPTNYCSYSCVMCPRSKHMKRPTGFMDPALFRRIIDEISSFAEPVRSKEIELFHFGESLYHPQIDQLVGYAAQRGLCAVMSVNAPELTPSTAEWILESGLSRLIVSLDGYDEASYRQIRGPGADFAKAVVNLRHLARLVSQGNSGTSVTLRMIRLHLNADHLEGFRQEWEQAGLGVEIRPFFPWTEKELVGLGEVQKYPPFMPCPFPWQYLAVQWDGTVVPCCRDYNGFNAMGNVLDQSLREIWNGSRYAEFREQHRTGQYGANVLCRECMDIFFDDGR